MSLPKTEHSVEIGGKTYLLRFKYKAIDLIENLVKPGMGNMETTKVILYAGLRKHHPEITLDGCADILDDVDDIKKTLDEITTAFQVSVGVPKKQEPEAVEQVTA